LHNTASTPDDKRRDTIMYIKTTTGAALLAAGLLAACAAPATVSVQPEYDKLGIAYCPTGFTLSGGVCVAPAGSAAAIAASGGDVVDGTAPAADPAAPGNQNRNTNQNTNQNRNNNRSGGA
jgi:hypothetical protein